MTENQPVQVRLSDEIIAKIDKLVETQKYDSRASFVRRAIIDKLEFIDKPIYA